MNLSSGQIPPDEMARRIRELRTALGFHQEELASIFGGGQPMISQWEKQKIKDYSTAISSFEALGRLLYDPVAHRHELGKEIEPFSPLAEEPKRLAEFVRSISKPITPDEWDTELNSFSFAHSRRPSTRSKILEAESKAGGESRKPAPKLDDANYDISQHGSGFHAFLASRASQDGIPRFAAKEIRAGLASKAGPELIKALVALKKPEYALEDYAENFVFYNSDKVLSADPRTSNTTSGELYSFALSFLGLVAALVDLKEVDGEVTFNDDRMHLVCQTLKSYVQEANELSSLASSDWQNKMRQINDNFSQAGKPKRRRSCETTL